MNSQTRSRSPTDYDNIADAYAGVADDLPGNKYYERPATIALLPPLGGLDVLDAGCGTGFYTALAAERGARVVGYDPSGEMVRHARARVGDAAELHHCKTAELEEVLGGRTFDLILSCLVLHYVEDLPAEAKLLAARIRPGGAMIVSMKHPLASPLFTRKRGYRATGMITNIWELGAMTQMVRPLDVVTDAWYQAGLFVERMVEPYPLPAFAEVAPVDYKKTMNRWPWFVQWVLRKPPIAGPL